MKMIEVQDLFVGYYIFDMKVYKCRFDIVMDWIAERIPEKDRKQAMLKLVENFKRTVEKPFPMIEDIKNIMITDETVEAEAAHAWEKLKKHTMGGYNNLLVADPYISFALERIGGWIEFSVMLKKDEPFKKKEFIQYYCTAVREGYKMDSIKEFKGSLELCRSDVLGEVKNDRGLLK